MRIKLVVVCVLCLSWATAGRAEERTKPSAESGAPSPAAVPQLGQSLGLRPTNAGGEQPLIFTGHVLSGLRESSLSEEEVREIRRRAAEAPVTVPEGEFTTNSGRKQRVEFTGHVLSYGPGTRAGGILYAPAQADSPTFRADLAACTGMTVDYFDARVATPDLVLLCTYDVVFTWPDLAYADNVAMGDVLADYVDIGCGKVILGQWCLPTQTYWLEGRIMDPGYCPVDATDDTRETHSYAGDGGDCVHYGPPYVGSYTTDFHDNCTLRSGAQSDGTFDDGWLSVAWRPDRKVYYSAGNTGTYYGTGEWHELVCNMALCVRPGGVLYAPSNPDNPEFRAAVASCLGVPCDYFDARVETPTLALLSNYECILTWTNYAYADNVAMGDVLADYVDAGYGRVILGQWTYHSDQGNYLDGRIMTPEYCPITSDSSYNHGFYNGDGVDCVHTRGGLVNNYDTTYLDNCTLVPGAFTDGTFNDNGVNRLSVSWRPDRRVYYSAGNTGGTLGTGDWAELVCNICKCFFSCGSPDAGSCCDANGTPGCDDGDCCQSVCSYDSYCCEVAWDSICAQEAAQDFNCLDCVCAGETTPPEAELTTPPELGEGCVCGLTDILGTANDPDGTFQGYTLDYRKLGTGSWTVIATGDTPVVDGLLGTWDAGALPGGYYMVRLTVTNTCGMSSTAVRSVFVDVAYGTLEVDYPTDGLVVGGNVCLDGTVYESWCGSTYTAEYSPAGAGLWQPVDPGQPVYPGTHINEVFANWDTVGLALPDGDYDLRVTAWNDCQHTKQVSLTVAVDNTYPVASITSPSNCASVSGLVEIVGTAFDAHLSQWVLQYTGGDTNGWITLTSDTTPVVNGVLYEWDVSNLPACAYTLRLLVYDGTVLNCNSPNRRRADYLVSVIVGGGFVLPGDLNCDGVVNAFDIDPFIHCITTGDCDCP